MFNLGFGEIVIICLILIVVVGPERLPSVMKNVGKTMRTVRQASRELRETVGLDELMREDVLRPMPPVRRPPPPATISRTDDTVAAPPAVPDAPPTQAPSPAPEVANANPSADAVDAGIANPQSGAAAPDPGGERKA